MKTIVFVGDSITDCGRKPNDIGPLAPLGAQELGYGYVLLLGCELLSRHPDWQIYNRGISGNRIVDVYARWKPDCLHLKPDILSILIGVNDVTLHFMADNGVGRKRFERFYRELLQWSQDKLPNCRLILGEPFLIVDESFSMKLGLNLTELAECRRELQPRQDMLRSLADEWNMAFIPYQDIFDRACEGSSASVYLSDGVHPTAAGHYIMAQEWLKVARNQFGDEFGQI